MPPTTRGAPPPVLLLPLLVALAACAGELPADRGDPDGAGERPDAAETAFDARSPGDAGATQPEAAVTPAPDAGSEPTPVPPPVPPPPAPLAWTEVHAAIAPRCVPCHAPPSNRAGLRLDDAEIAYTSLVNVDATTRGCGGALRVVPGDAARSVLYRKLAGTELCGGNRMPPPPRSALGADALALVERWIDQGAAP